tara:strand:+ start:624 stop:911 length:288 start_codon:yes stop_codon:yes gene_type:complete
MTELEYKLMSTIAYAIDLVADFSDDMDEFACEVDDESDYRRAHELADDVLRINTLLADTFNRAKEENKDEWDTLQKVECKIIEKTIKERHEQKGL